MRRILILFLFCLLLLSGCSRVALAPTLAPVQNMTPTPTADVTVFVTTPTPLPTQSPTPTPEPTPDPTPTPDLLKTYVANMTDRELVGQMVMIGFTGTESVPGDFAALAETYSVGNYILFGWNVEDFDQTTRLCSRIHDLNTSAIPLTISIDVEGGTVRRFSWTPRLKSQQALAEGGDIQAAYNQGLRIGQALSETGITMDLAPVLDVADPNRSFMGSRIFSSNPLLVGEMGVAEIQGLRDGGVLAMAKHFPGHGDTSVDPHNNLPVRETTLEELKAYDVVSFQAVVDDGVDAILVGHISFPNIDDKWVASLSPSIIKGLLRNDMGFDGVIMSDDMRMQAVAAKYNLGEAAVQHILAGGDIVLIGKGLSNQKSICAALLSAIEEGSISRERAEQSVYRVLRMKGFAG